MFQAKKLAHILVQIAAGRFPDVKHVTICDYDELRSHDVFHANAVPYLVCIK